MPATKVKKSREIWVPLPCISEDGSKKTSTGALGRLMATALEVGNARVRLSISLKLN